MQRHKQAIVTVALAGLLAAPVAAADPGWTLRLHGAWVRPSLDLPRVDSDVPVDVGSRSALGAGAALEYRVQRWIGLALDGLHSRPGIVLDVDLPDGRRRVTDALGFTPISVGPVLHLTPGKVVDLTLAATAGLVLFGDLAFAADGETLELQGGSAFGWSLGAAVDVHPGASDWAIHAGVRRFASNPTFTNSANGGKGSMTFNPVVVTFGVAYRF